MLMMMMGIIIITGVKSYQLPLFSLSKSLAILMPSGSLSFTQLAEASAMPRLSHSITRFGSA
jgi:hypothetical protein